MKTRASIFFFLSLACYGQAPIRTVRTLAELDAWYPSANLPLMQVLDFPDGPKTFRYDPTNSLPTNAIRRATITGSGRWIHDWDGDVQVFGARNDSGVTTNNSPMIQAAADTAAELGIPLVIEGDGTNYYQIDEGIELQSGTKVIGRNAWIRKKDGVGAYAGDVYQATVFRNANPDETVDANLDAITDDHDISLVGLGGFVIDGNGGNSQSQLTNSHPSHVVRLIGVNRVRVQDITIKDGAFFGLLLGSCRQAHISGLTVTNAFTSRNTDPDQGRNNDGIHVSGCIDVLIENCIVYSTDDCIGVSTFNGNTRNLVASGNILHQMIGTNATWTPRAVAVHVGPNAGPTTENVVIANNVANVRSGSGFTAYRTSGNTSSVPVKGVIFANNFVLGDGTERATSFGNVAGLSASGVEGVDFVGNVVSNFVGRGVWVNNAKRLRFIDNRIYTQRRQTVADATPFGFYLDTSGANLEDIEIRGGVIEDTISGISVFPSTNYYVTNLAISDVRIANTTSNLTTLFSSLQYGAAFLFNAHRVRVNGLRIEGVPSSGISVLTGSDVEVRNNRIRGTDLPIVLSGVSGSRITDNWISDQVLESGISPAGAVYLWQNYGPNTDCEIANNRFEGIPRAGIYVPSGGVGTNLVVRGNTFLRGGTTLGSVTNDALADDYAAVSIQGPGGTLVERNSIRAWDAGGIWLSGATNLVIRDNFLDTIGITTNAHGIYVRAEDATTPADLVTISDNRVSNVTGYGIGIQSARRWDISRNTLWNCSTINTGSADVFVDVNGASAADTAGFDGRIVGNTIYSGTASYGIRGQVRLLPAGINSGNWNGTRWVVSGNSVLSSSVPYNFTPTLNAVGVVEGTPVWRATIGTTNYTFEGHHKILDYFNAADLTVTLPSAASMANFGEFLLFKAGANTNMVTVSRSDSDTINGQTSISWTNQFRGYKFRSISGAWYADQVGP